MLSKQRAMVRQAIGCEPGGHAEKQIQRAQQRRGPARLAKLGDEPQCAGLRGARGTLDQTFQIALIETVEKKVGDDQVVSRRAQAER